MTATPEELKAQRQENMAKARAAMAAKRAAGTVTPGTNPATDVDPAPAPVVKVEEATRPTAPGFTVTAVMDDSFMGSVLSVDGLPLAEHEATWIMRTKARNGMEIAHTFDGTGDEFTVRAVFAEGVFRLDGTDYPVTVVDHPEFRGSPALGPAVFKAESNR